MAVIQIPKAVVLWCCGAMVCLLLLTHVSHPISGSYDDTSYGTHVADLGEIRRVTGEAQAVTQRLRTERLKLLAEMGHRSIEHTSNNPPNALPDGIQQQLHDSETKQAVVRVRDEQAARIDQVDSSNEGLATEGASAQAEDKLLGEGASSAERISRALATVRAQQWAPLATHLNKPAPPAKATVPRTMLRARSATTNISFAHLLNPVDAPAGSSMHKAQQMTFATIEVSKKYTQGNVDVDVVTTQYEEDLPVLVPPSFRPIHNLKYSSADVIDEPGATKKLPLVRDLLMAAYNHTTASHIIYSNVDIAVMPSFYENIRSIIHCGTSAFAINRVEIPGNFGFDTYVCLRLVIQLKLQLITFCYCNMWAGGSVAWSKCTKLSRCTNKLTQGMIAL